MKSILLIGLGRFGIHLAMKLVQLRHEVLAVDINEDKVDAVLPYVTSAQIGDGTNEEFLSSLGVSDFDVCFVAIGDNFQASLETTSLLKDLGAPFVVSLAARDVHAKFLLRNGADRIIYPEKQIAEWAAIRYSSDNVLDFIALDDTHSIFEVTVPEQWAGKEVGALNVRRNHQISILAIKHGTSMNMNVNSDTVLQRDDTLLVLGEMRAIQRTFHI